MNCLCICGTNLSTKKGMKIHWTKVKCLDNSKNQQQCSVQADKTLENQGEVQNISDAEIYASDLDMEFKQLLDAKIRESYCGKRV
ncbi:reverse transcriptase [Plakobranchus ocellatus]|uniref:Reverse transcriptase n=1 Tax=Plakobranchus ocellatus TaxID=259542 RepID=A0AAV3ZTE3_9GAST|nr:reverse transcriptase [Plakobranchus ocellatus]